MNDSHLPDEINMTGKMNGREFDLQLGAALEASVIFDCHPAMLLVELAKIVATKLRDFPTGPLVCWDSIGF